MPSLAVVEDVDVFGDLSDGLRTRFVTPVVHEFVLEGSPETFHRGIVVAVAASRHGRLHARLFQQIPIVASAIRRAAIRMVNQPWGRALGRHGLHERATFEFAGVDILDAGQNQPALTPVWTVVMSVTQAAFGRVVSNF